MLHADAAVKLDVYTGAYTLTYMRCVHAQLVSLQTIWTMHADTK